MGTSTEPGAFEVVEGEDRVVVYAWPGSTVQVFQGEALVNDLNVAVPGTAGEVDAWLHRVDVRWARRVALA